MGHLLSELCIKMRLRETSPGLAVEESERGVLRRGYVARKCRCIFFKKIMRQKSRPKASRLF